MVTSTPQTSADSAQQLRLPQHSSPLQVYKPGFVTSGHISSIGTKTTYSPSNLIPTTCSLSSPLVIPTLNRASSTGTFIPHTELSVPATTVSVSANINTVVTAAAKTTLALTSVDSAVSSASLINRSAGGGASGSTTNIGAISTESSNPNSKMQDQPEEQDKKPIVPPPGAFITAPGAVPFAPYHSFYYPHSGAAHLPHFHPSVAMSVASSSGGSSHQSTPPVPSLVPIKKEPHSPPPPLKPSDKATDLSSGSTNSSLHRPHTESTARLPHGFSQPGLSSTAPLPPPPLTVIDHRDSSKSGELSKADSFPKDSNWSLPSSPHHSENHPAPGLHRESRLDSNLSVLRESREIGLVVGLNSSQPGQQLSLSSIKEEPRSIPAAFQPYSHHAHPSSSSSSLTSHHTPGSILQVPQPSISSEHAHSTSSVTSSQSVLSDSSHVSSHSTPSLDIENLVKKEQIAVDEVDVDEDDDDSRGGSTTPGPTPTVCNREIYKSNSAM